MEQQDEWTAAPRRYFSQASMAKLYTGNQSVSSTDFLALSAD